MKNEIEKNIEPQPDRPKYMTIEEMERYERMIFRRYTRKDGKEKDKYFYKILGMHSYQFAGVAASTDEVRYQFEVQKFYRDKFSTVTSRDENNNAMDIKTNAQVGQHVLHNDRWVCMDPEASFFIDVQEFESKFAADTE